jgi:hypothetical protein
MPIDIETHDPSDPVDVEPNTNQAEALCFLYANPDYGFKPAEVREHTSIPNNSAYKALSRLYEKDLIGKTADGFYHALADQTVSQYADTLRNGEAFDMDNEPDSYPEDVDNTTTGFPDDDTEIQVDHGTDAESEWKEQYPDE